ncbi:uncharacterized protein N7477_003167 [Penicillium maclennaniae]|uniref:uncharacterized protein n=1 Tax=Penicillium maclennaniae TaxID=1343394 RepID=UPI002540412E|nr:uncharacterized protein N7477_003167 [Penicillium maclennaniae]KAJ5677534.1 hypothetical protein N7477_003167 [Penicillium maclennaniae]
MPERTWLSKPLQDRGVHQPQLVVFYIHHILTFTPSKKKTSLQRDHLNFNAVIFQEEIAGLVWQKLNLRNISRALKQKHGVNVSAITIQRRV